jgi:hypothetical protein
VLTGLANREIFRTNKGRQLTDAAYANLETEISALVSNGSLRSL